MKRQQQDNRRFVLGLAITLAVMSLGLALLTTVFVRQATTVEETAKLQTDSVTFMTFQFEREFLRFRSTLDRVLNGRHPDDWNQLQLRFDILLSRADLLVGNPTIRDLTEATEYTQTLPQVRHLLERIDLLMDEPWQHQTALRGVLEEMNTLGPDVQAMSLSADRLITHQLEDKVNLLRTQNRWIVWLVAMQAVVLLLASVGLWFRHLRLSKERLALQTLNQELVRATEAAQQANHSKSQFLANMSHELRTPFNGMLGMIELLEESQLNTEQHEQLLTAKKSAQHLLNILNDILDMSALDAGKLRIHLDTVKMFDLVHDVHQLFVAQGALKHLEMPLDWSEHNPEWVMTDATRIRQILLNLLNNAIKFTDQGFVKLRVSAQIEGDKALWSIEVQDSGVGIDADKVDQLFQRFQQADDSATRRFGGTGLGLDISRKLAQMLGGDIAVKSRRGKGSTFTATLRTTLADPPQPILDTDVTVIASSALEVLVAEDHPVNQKVVGLLLSKLGHQVTFAANGLEALEQARSKRFDIILMDVHMPEMDGLESAEKIRALPSPLGQVPIVALSADVMNEAKDRALAVGMNGFISKPVQTQELESTIRACLPT